MFAWEIRDRLLMDGMPANKVKFLYDLFDHLTLRRNLFTSKVSQFFSNFVPDFFPYADLSFKIEGNRLNVAKSSEKIYLIPGPISQSHTTLETKLTTNEGFVLNALALF